jgi:hypothetical protein
LEGSYIGSILYPGNKSNPFKTENPLLMQRRVRKVVNFFAFNLLFFALYLNFVHKDAQGSVPDPNQVAKNPAFSGALTSNDQVKNDQAMSIAKGVAISREAGESKALKLSIN